jgi:hypothetical protein
MSETTSVEGVLAAHSWICHDDECGTWYCDGCDVDIPDAIDPILGCVTPEATLIAHQADELRKAGLVRVTCQACRDTGNVGTGLGQQCGACAPGSQAEHATAARTGCATS